MREGLPSVLDTLLNTTDSLGVGCIDANGLLVDSRGEHAGKNPHELACYLSHSRPDDLANYLGDSVSEHIIIGIDYHFYLRWLPHNLFLMYVMTHPRASGGNTRHVLYKQSKKLYLTMESYVSGITFRERLEQPRKFIYTPLFGQGSERVYQKL
ncbi:MAG: hypothetical protein KC422_03625 [Trueperaceae bacterium]|nr:hypothetical protein [Trueperaceae bacterium]